MWGIVKDGLFTNFGPAGYYGTQFEYWRGDMEYLLVIPVSKIHRGTVQIIWNASTDVDITVDPTNTAFNLLHDVSAGGEIEYAVGYANKIPFLTTYPQYTGVDIVAVGACNGLVTIRVVNPLAGQSAAAVVNCHLYARAASNMKFALPKALGTFPGLTADVPCANSLLYVLQAADGDGDSHMSTMQTLVARSGDYNMEGIGFGHETCSIRALLQKPSLLNFGDTTEMIRPFNFSVPHYLPPPCFSADPSVDAYPEMKPFNNYQATWASFFMAPFVGFASSVRWKVICADEGWVSIAPVNIAFSDTGPTQQTPLSHLHPPVWNGGSHGYEVTIPYNMPQKFIPQTELLTNAAPDNIGRRRTNFSLYAQKRLADGSKTFSEAYQFWYSLGPDIRCAGFKQIPGVLAVPSPSAVTGQISSPFVQIPDVKTP